MATGDGINKSGSYAAVQASASVADGAMSGGANTTIAAAIPAESEYFLLDFQAVVTGTQTDANGVLNIYKRPSDGTTPAPAPTASTFESIYVGSIKLDTSAGTYYLRGVVNDDPSDTYYVQNKGGNSLTLTLNARGRTYRVE